MYKVIWVNIVVAEYNTDLSTVHEQLRQYILQIEDRAALEERNRIAREIHDSLGNALTTLNIQLQTALKLWHLDPDHPWTKEVSAIAKQIMHNR